MENASKITMEDIESLARCFENIPVVKPIFTPPLTRAERRKQKRRNKK